MLPVPQAITQEFTQQSAIAPDLFEQAIGFIDELELDAKTGEVVSTPIHDLLGWKFTRFGHQARNLSAALFINEDGSIWQAKVFGLKSGERSGRYFAPKGNGNRPYFPPVPQRIREKIAKEYKLTPPDPEQSFWLWVLSHPQIPITVTEGGKKALAGIAKGILTIALYGCLCGDSEELKPYLKNRKIYIGYDRDTKKSAKKAVAKGIHKLSWAILKEKGEPRILLWDAKLGKGLDDLAVNGVNLNALVTDSQSLSYHVWKSRNLKQTLAKYHPYKVKQRYLSLEALHIPQNAQLIGLSSAKGTGKTEVLAVVVSDAIAKGIPVIAIGHRIKLMVEMSQRLGLDYRTDDSEVKALLGYCLCINSLHPKANPSFDPDYWGEKGGIVLMDEVEQVIWSLLNDDTLKEHRTLIVDTLQRFLRKTLENGGKIYLADADLSSTSVDCILSLIGLPIDPYIIQNTYKSPVSRSLRSFERKGECLDALTEHLRENQGNGTIFIATGAQKATSTYGTINLEKILGKIIPPEKILRIDSESVSDPHHAAYRCTDNLTEVITGYWVVIASPTLETGVSLTGDGFNSVWAFSQGTQTVNGVCQAMSRVRSDVPRFLFAPKFHNRTIGGGSDNPQELTKRENILTSHTLIQLQTVENLCTTDGTNPEILNTWAIIAAGINADARRYRDAILEKLESEGYTITQSPKNPSPSGKAIKAVRDESVRELSEKISQAPNPDDLTYKRLQEQAEKTETERNTEAHGRLARTYLTEDVTPELAEKDMGGWLSQLSLTYYLTVGREFLKTRDHKKLTQLGKENDGKVFSPDVNKATLTAKIQALEALKIEQFFDTTKEFTSEMLRGWMDDYVLPYRRDIKRILNLWVNELESPVAIAQKILAKLGLKMKCYRRRVNGVLVRFYRLVTFDPDNRGEVLERWLERDKAVCATSPSDDLYMGGYGTRFDLDKPRFIEHPDTA